MKTINWVSLFCLVSIIGPVLPATALDVPFNELIHRQSSQIAQVTSDKAALALFSKEFVAPLGMNQGKRHRSATRSQNPSKSAVAFIAEVAALQYSTTLINMLMSQDWDKASISAKQSSDHLTWIEHTLALSQGRTMAMWWNALHDLMSRKPLRLLHPTHYETFAQSVEQTYPDWQGPEHAQIIGLIQQEGLAGILSRLNHLWDNLDQQQPPIPMHIRPEERKAEVNRYLHIRVLPIIQIHVMSELTTLRMKAYDNAQRSWNNLKQWNQTRLKHEGLLRLCGTWQWTVHNHQNHQDHKMTMIFPHPTQIHTMNPPLSNITVLGDTVYLQWDFPRGFQENSLLFSGQDKRLEGTFYNSAGPNGNITGRRIARCKK